MTVRKHFADLLRSVANAIDPRPLRVVRFTGPSFIDNQRPVSVADLVSRWPTIAQFSIEVGCGYEAARKMVSRERVHPKHWENVKAASERRGIPGVTIDWLAAQYGPQGGGWSAPERYGRDRLTENFNIADLRALGAPTACLCHEG